MSWLSIASLIAPISCFTVRVAVMNLDAEEKTLQVRLIDLEGTIVGTGTMTADLLAANGHIARFLDEFNWDEPAPGLTHFQGVLEVVPSNGQVAATVLRLSSGKSSESTRCADSRENISAPLNAASWFRSVMPSPAWMTCRRRPRASPRAPSLTSGSWSWRHYTSAGTLVL